MDRQKTGNWKLEAGSWQLGAGSCLSADTQPVRQTWRESRAENPALRGCDGILDAAQQDRRAVHVRIDREGRARVAVARLADRTRVDQIPDARLNCDADAVPLDDAAAHPPGIWSRRLSRLLKH